MDSEGVVKGLYHIASTGLQVSEFIGEYFREG